jgi:hypothetical protein
MQHPNNLIAVVFLSPGAALAPWLVPLGSLQIGVKNQFFESHSFSFEFTNSQRQQDDFWREKEELTLATVRTYIGIGEYEDWRLV